MLGNIFGRSLPEEVQLKCEIVGRGGMNLMVDAVPNAMYKWQFCKAGTATWNTVQVTNSNIHTINVDEIKSKGDQYRCIIIDSRKKVRFYSKVLTIGRKVYKSEYEYTNQNEYEQTYGSKKEKEPSVADTDGMEGFEFEAYCAEVLKKNGFYNVTITQASGDYGIDLLAEKDSVKYAIQCKCYSGTVGNKAVQEAYSGKSVYNCMVAAVLTNNYFTEAAKETAKKNAVILWNREELDAMIKGAWHNRTSENRKEEEKRSTDSQEDIQGSHTSAPDFFKGCSNWEQVKERYKKLMLMYHPDNESGDEEYAQAINKQYNQQKSKYGE